MDDSKYIVVKRSDLDELKAKFEQNPNYLQAFDILTEHQLEDAVVIRRQDVFAPPALDAYAGAILTAVEIIKADGGPIGRAEKLEGIATFFHQQAALAWDTNRKIPD